MLKVRKQNNDRKYKKSVGKKVVILRENNKYKR